MSAHVTAPWLVRWIAAILRELPGPTEPWARIISAAFWPLLTCFLVVHFRSFLRRILATFASRMETDRVKLGWFEISPNDPLMVLDPSDASTSASQWDPTDIRHIERMFEFIADQAGLDGLRRWVSQNVDHALNVEEFLTSPKYAMERARAWNQVEGLRQ